jgi:hypothetical protein
LDVIRESVRIKMVGYAMTEPDPATVPALLRAALAGDEDAARVIVDRTGRLRLIFAVVAWADTMRAGADFAVA